MVNGLWLMVYGLRFMVHGLWFMVYSLWLMVYGLWLHWLARKSDQSQTPKMKKGAQPTLTQIYATAKQLKTETTPENATPVLQIVIHAP